jgi:ribosomal protein L37AE/L43A
MRNIWECQECGEKYSSVASIECPKCHADFSKAVYPPSRVKRDRYQAYAGTTDWEISANAGMRLEANYNFSKM